MYEQLKFPATAMIITKEMVKIATFDLIPTEWISELLWYFPEQEAFSLNFEQSGIESILFLQNAGLILYLVLFNILCFVTCSNKMRISMYLRRYLKY